MKIKNALLASLFLLIVKSLAGQTMFLDQTNPAGFVSFSYSNSDHQTGNNYLFGLAFPRSFDIALEHSRGHEKNDLYKFKSISPQLNYYPLKALGYNKISLSIHLAYLNEDERKNSSEFIDESVYTRRKETATIGSAFYYRWQVNSRTQIVPETGIFWHKIKTEDTLNEPYYELEADVYYSSKWEYLVGAYLNRQLSEKYWVNFGLFGFYEDDDFRLKTGLGLIFSR